MDLGPTKTFWKTVSQFEARLICDFRKTLKTPMVGVFNWHWIVEIQMNPDTSEIINPALLIHYWTTIKSRDGDGYRSFETTDHNPNPHPPPPVQTHYWTKVGICSNTPETNGHHPTHPTPTSRGNVLVLVQFFISRRVLASSSAESQSAVIWV